MPAYYFKGAGHSLIPMGLVTLFWAFERREDFGENPDKIRSEIGMDLSSPHAGVWNCGKF